jgi:mannose-1-phosphate guanylyltransferase / mannose-6-phosphate isomerase
MALIPIILSGGTSARLWPLAHDPLAEMALPGVDGQDTSLLARSFVRAAALPDVAGLLTVTRRDYFAETRDDYESSGAVAPPRFAYLLEPFGRNTAAAVALGALYVEANFGGDAIMLVLPGDHLINGDEAFQAAIASATALARSGWLATVGIAPTTPETGYGYLQVGDALELLDAFAVQRFVEKPDLADARRYVDSGRHLWNAGMFCFSAARAKEAFSCYAPDVLAALKPVWKDLQRSADAGVLEIDSALFEAVPQTSFDVAVMEKADRVAVVKGRFSWVDVGSWRALAELSPRDSDGNRGQGERVMIATRDTYVYAQSRVVATIGVDGLVIVETPTGVLVASREHLERVKEVVAELEARERRPAPFHKPGLGRPKGGAR